jgi:hypothetical protein
MNEIIIAQGIEQEAATFILKDLAKKSKDTLIEKYPDSFVFLGANEKAQMIYYNPTEKAIKQREI